MPIINSLKSVTAFGMLACSLIVAAGNRVVAVAPQEESTKPPRTGLTTEPTPTIPPQRRFSETRQRQMAYLRYIEAQRLKGEAQRQRSTRLLEDAIKAYKDTIQLDPSAPDPHVDLGELYFLYLSRRDLAEREALEAIRLDPKSVDGHLLLARLYVSQTKTETNVRSSSLDRAIREYEKVAELDHNQAEAWALLSDLYQLKNDPERRANALEKWAAALPPNDTFFYRWLMNSELSSDQAYFQLSQLYLGQGRNRAAIDAARRAYEADPESNANARNLINILRVAGTSEEELRIYSQLVKSANSPALLIGYGSALVRARRNAEAVERLQEYVKLDQTNASALALLAIAQRRSNQRSAAIGTLKAGIAHVDSSTKVDLQIMLAETYEESGRNEEAIAQYEQIFESFLPKGSLTPVNMPLFSEVVNRLARVYRRVGNQVRLQTMLARTRRVIDERNPLLDVVAIDSLREDGRRREALEQVQSATRRFPDDRVLK
ncbi:MAG TPA: tetratricopeptide repeat protein, partial [Blastocatellia bacterium]|nr:tetratricopeptide repeat protein [Blastocatellia bacterium]